MLNHIFVTGHKGCFHQCHDYEGLLEHAHINVRVKLMSVVISVM